MQAANPLLPGINDSKRGGDSTQNDDGQSQRGALLMEGEDDINERDGGTNKNRRLAKQVRQQNEDGDSQFDDGEDEMIEDD